MRAVWFGLVGAVLAAGAAQAKGCVIVERPREAYAAASPMQHPELVGSVFRIVRTTSNRKSTFVESRQVNMRLGYEAYEIKGKAGIFVVRRDYVPGTPAVQPVSSVGSDSSVTWHRSAPAAELSDHILDGPLSDLVLKPRSCRL